MRDGKLHGGSAILEPHLEPTFEPCPYPVLAAAFLQSPSGCGPRARVMPARPQNWPAIALPVKALGRGSPELDRRTDTASTIVHLLNRVAGRRSCCFRSTMIGVLRQTNSQSLSAEPFVGQRHVVGAEKPWHVSTLVKPLVGSEYWCPSDARPAWAMRPDIAKANFTMSWTGSLRALMDGFSGWTEDQAADSGFLAWIGERAIARRYDLAKEDLGASRRSPYRGRWAIDKQTYCSRNAISSKDASAEKPNWMEQQQGGWGGTRLATV